MRLVMIKSMCKNEKGYSNENLNILINMIMQIWFKYEYDLIELLIFELSVHDY